MKHGEILPLAMLLLANTAYASADIFVQNLEREETTWHKYGLFDAIRSTSNNEERSAALVWLRERINSGAASDSRYAITYSQLLWQDGENNAMEESIVFGLAGYMALQIESAHCQIRNESILISRQWYAPVRPQMLRYLALPKEKKETAFSMALIHENQLSSRPASSLQPGSTWMCHLVPSYVSKIGALQGVKYEVYKNRNTTLVFASHPEVKPAIVSEQQLSERKAKIIEDLKNQ